MLRELLERFNCETDKRDKKVCVLRYACTVGIHIHTDSEAEVHKTGISAGILLFLLQFKWTPLYAVAETGHMKVVQYLIDERGYDPTVRCDCS